MSGTIDYSSSDGIARLTISQPEKHNALTLAMWRAIPALVARAIDEQDVRVIALTGAGNSAFSAGADISRFAVERDGAVAVQAYDEAVAAAETALVQAAKPTLALVTGLCFGGGVGLASSCDIRLVNASARFRVPAARLGIGYAPRGIARLVHLIGPSATAEIFFTARTYDADEALAIGLATRLFPDTDFATLSGQYLAAIAENAPLSLSAAKLTLREFDRPESSRDFADAEAMVAACYESADYAEGRLAFTQKRPPVFLGR